MLSEITKEVGFHTIHGLAGILSPASQKMLSLCEIIEAWDQKCVQPLFEAKHKFQPAIKEEDLKKDTSNVKYDW